MPTRQTLPKTVCVFCSADDKVPADYKQTAYDLGNALASNAYKLLSGGGNSGLMKEVNDGHAQAAPPTARFAVVPQILRGTDEMHPHIDPNNYVWCADVHSRLKNFYEYCDDIVVLPGGYGTLHELMDCLVLSQFGIIKKRIYLLNVDNFWDGILEQFNVMVLKRTLHKPHFDYLIVAHTIPELIANLNSPDERQLSQGFADQYWKANSDNTT